MSTVRVIKQIDSVYMTTKPWAFKINGTRHHIRPGQKIRLAAQIAEKLILRGVVCEYDDPIQRAALNKAKLR